MTYEVTLQFGGGVAGVYFTVDVDNRKDLSWLELGSYLSSKHFRRISGSFSFISIIHAQKVHRGYRRIYRVSFQKLLTHCIIQRQSWATQTLALRSNASRLPKKTLVF